MKTTALNIWRVLLIPAVWSLTLLLAGVFWLACDHDAAEAVIHEFTPFGN